MVKDYLRMSIYKIRCQQMGAPGTDWTLTRQESRVTTVLSWCAWACMLCRSWADSSKCLCCANLRRTSVWSTWISAGELSVYILLTSGLCLAFPRRAHCAFYDIGLKGYERWWVVVLHPFVKRHPCSSAEKTPFSKFGFISFLEAILPSPFYWCSIVSFA